MATDLLHTVKRGETLYEATPSSTPGNIVLGDVVEFRDTENGTQRRLRARLVRNGTGSDLTSVAGRPFRYAANGHGLTVDGYAKLVGNSDFAGWGDAMYAGKTVKSNDAFWIIEPSRELPSPSTLGPQTDTLNALVQDYLARRGGVIEIYEQFLGGSTLPVSLATVGSGGTTSVQDIQGGMLRFAANAADNATWGFVGANECFLFSPRCAIVYETRVRPVATTANQNYVFGMVNAAAAAVPITTSGALVANMSGLFFWKAEGGSVWRAVHQITTTLREDTDCGAFTSNTWVHLRITWVPTSATAGVATFEIDGTVVYTTPETTFDALATEMKLVSYVLTAEATAHYFECAYVYAAQIRPAV
jgi:hypothetical protein